MMISLYKYKAAFFSSFVLSFFPLVFIPHHRQPPPTINTKFNTTAIPKMIVLEGSFFHTRMSE